MHERDVPIVCLPVVLPGHSYNTCLARTVKRSVGSLSRHFLCEGGDV